LIGGAAAGKGRGKEVISVVRSADLILILIDIFSEWQAEVIKRELYDAGIRINERRPNIVIKKKSRGGVLVKRAPNAAEIDEATIIAILHDFKIHNADVLLKEDATVDQLIDALVPSRRFIPAITVVNKIDQSSSPPGFGDVHISAEHHTNVDRLKEVIFEKLRFIRVFLKPPRQPPDTENPLILRQSSTIEEVCNLMHGQFSERFRYAHIWGPSARHPGQRVGLDHILLDSDTVTLVASRK
jgi:hypothetical protein